MNKEMIKIYGDNEDRKAIEKIICGVEEKLPEAKAKVEIFLAGSGDYERESVVIARIPEKDKFSDAQKLITYSEGFSDADVVSLNPQKRDLSSSVEVMTEGFMGRAFMKNDGEFTAFQVLMAFCVLYALGVTAQDALQIINDFTMKRNEE